MPRSLRTKKERRRQKHWATRGLSRRVRTALHAMRDVRMAAANDKPVSDEEADECAHALLKRE